MILTTCFVKATAEDSREPIERFYWLMSTNRCEASYEGGVTLGSVRKNRCSVATFVASRTKSLNSTNASTKKMREMSVMGYVTLGVVLHVPCKFHLF